MRVSRPLIQSSVSSEDDFPFFFLPSGFSAWAPSSFSLRGTTIIYIFFVVKSPQSLLPVTEVYDKSLVSAVLFLEMLGLEVNARKSGYISFASTPGNCTTVDTLR